MKPMDPDQIKEGEKAHRLFIGMPVYNGAAYIREALDSLVSQSYQDWTMLISDNASEDETPDICKEYCKKDERIRYVRQERNIGPVANFKYLLDQADAPFFMWAASDDTWHPDFIASCMQLLEKEGTIGFVFSNLAVIDSQGRMIRDIPSFEKFSGKPSFRIICRYLLDPEINGKACLIYGIFRTEICRQSWVAVPDMGAWGSDYQFVLAAISRGGVLIEKKVLFFKRFLDGSTHGTYPKPDMILHPSRYTFPFLTSYPYIWGTVQASSGTPFYWATLVLMVLRLPGSFFNFLRGLRGSLKEVTR